MLFVFLTVLNALIEHPTFLTVGWSFNASDKLQIKALSKHLTHTYFPLTLDRVLASYIF